MQPLAICNIFWFVILYAFKIAVHLTIMFWILNAKKKKKKFILISLTKQSW